MTMTATLGDATVAELRSAVAGTVTVPGDPDYELARRIWNHAIDRYPTLDRALDRPTPSPEPRPA